MSLFEDLHLDRQNEDKVRNAWFRFGKDCFFVLEMFFFFFTQFIFVGNFNCLLELKLFSFLLSMDIIKAEESVLFVFLHRVESINSSTFTKREEGNMTKKE